MQGRTGPCFIGWPLITDPETEGRGVGVTRRQPLPGPGRHASLTPGSIPREGGGPHRLTRVCHLQT